MADTDKELRAFKFLPNLPKSNLDDRSFDDLLQECILRIPRYCPEWTNYNPSDPGITLVEMFAWLTDQMLYRFNQVPRRYYVAFLELLGIRLQPAVPARADLTFYLTIAQSSIKCIPKGTEVATIRTETQEAVVFTTDEDLVIGQPKIKYLLTSLTNSDDKADNFENSYTFNEDGAFINENTDGNVYLLESCEINNCFYLVLEAPAITLSESILALSNDTSSQTQILQNSIIGNVIALTFKGIAAATTGINPDDPPLTWQAWDGCKWVDGILQQRQDDKTKGFSFHQTQPQQGADIILHLPLSFPEVEFNNYQGYWIRCVYTQPKGFDAYMASPQISSVTVRAIGGAVRASECITVEDELLGISDGKPGQFFQLQGYPVLKRKQGEVIQVTLPRGEPEDWTEVEDFAVSTPRDKHYIIDSRTGEVQFGPLVREPNQLLHQINDRRLRQRGQDAYPSSNSNNDNYLEWQYGEIPLLGAEIRMKSYRFGGGSRGNVACDQLTVLRTAIPYVKNVTNYREARGGKEAESLDQVVMRVPEILRTSKTAITPEDFQNIAKIPSVYNAYCPPCDSPGYVRALIIPDPRNSDDLKEADFLQLFPEGIIPEKHLKLDSKLKQELESKFNEHKSLGIKVEIEEPQYVGIKVLAEVFLQNKYQNQNEGDIKQRIIKKLHYFLNPITGGFEQKGWKIGASIKVAEIIAFLQNMPEIAYVGAIEVFCVRKITERNEWVITQNRDNKMIIELNEFEVISSWTDENLNLNSVIAILRPM